jgi:7,8-dihydropterin-6-yl-methyl-4-(beta-D-ribofuranosyl)aminobenzene 5'-phosphate synthase
MAKFSNSIESGKVRLKVLTNNLTSLTNLTEAKFKGKVIQPMTAANRVVGEHGLSIAIEIEVDDSKHLFLMDTGSLPQSIFENSKQLGVDLSQVEKLLLTHGHFDHFGGLLSLLPQLKERTEFYLNPKCYEQTVIILPKPGMALSKDDLSLGLRELEKTGKIQGSKKLPLLNKKMVADLVEQNNIKKVETNEPVELYKGFITSGEIELFNPDEVTPNIYLQKGKNKFERHTFRDETALYFNIKDKGLVVLTGCGHCGIQNTIKHGQKLTGVDKIYAVIGGFHEEWNPIEKIKRKVEYFEEINPEIICGMHCTGFNFNKLMSDHPAHTLGVVGTQFNL